MKPLITVTDLNEISTGIKAMKADYVCVNGDMLLGTNKTFTILKTYKMNKVIHCPVFTIITKELSSNFYSNIIDTNIVLDFDELKIYCPNNKEYADSIENKMISINNKPILDIYNRLLNELNTENIIDLGDITSDEYYQEFTSMKSSQGARFYTPMGNYNYGIYLYNNAIPVNKNDKVSLKVIDKGNTNILIFTVYKKKLNPIDICFRVLKMNT